MSSISRFLWLIPFAAQVAYIFATHEEMPRLMGATANDPGTRAYMFIAEWFAVVGMANIIFVFVDLRLPSFSDRMLSVPGKSYWLSTPATRAALVEKLRGICEAALLLLNIFFLAVYQFIYQTNVARPVFQIPGNILLFGFVALPIAVIVGYILWTLWALSSTARSIAAAQKDSKNDSKDA